MASRAEYDKTLTKLAALLKRKPLTAGEVAEAMNRCKPQAYQMLRALESRGVAVYRLAATSTRPGPKAVLYGVR